MQTRKRTVIIITTILLLLITMTGAAQASPGESTAISQAASKFQDVTPNNPNLVYINYLVSKGIMKGFPDGTFRPAEGLTRAQAAAVVALAAGLKTESAQPSPFTDVAMEHWANSYIAAAQKAGYISGFPDKTFRPEEKITRAQGIAMLMKMSTQTDSTPLPLLQDMDQNHWAAEAMGVALAAQMIGLSPDGTQVYPEAELKRASLARALGTLLTKDPGLYTQPLTGTLKEIQGQIQLTRNGKTTPIQRDTPVYAGDTINSGTQSSARLIYPDGSALMIDQNTEMTIKVSKGREYIKKDGTSNTAVEYLNLDVKKGSVFGAVATKKEATPKAQAQNQRPLLASLNSPGLLAANQTQQDMPWYNTAQTKKVKVKVDMPWGVAAVRGTFLKVTVNPDGTCNVSCLTGTIDVSGTTGGTVTLGGNQSGTIGQGGTTGQPAGMSEQDKQDFARVQDFIVESALQMDQQQEAAVSLIIETPDNIPVEQQEQQLQATLDVVLNALKASGIELTQAVKDNLIKQLGEELNIPPAQSSNTSSNSSSPSLAVITYGIAGTYGSESSSSPQTISGDVIVSAAGVTLQNMSIKGRLYLAEGIGEGHVTLNNVKVEGETIITGGGPSSIEIIDCELYTVTIDKENNQIRIIAKGNTSLGTVNLNSGARLEESNLTGTGFAQVNLSQLIPAGANIVLTGNFAAVNIAAPGINIQVEGGSIEQVNIAATAAGTSLNLAAGVAVSSLQIYAANTQVTGTGTINTASINANGVVLTQKPANTIVAEGITAYVGGQTVTSQAAVTIAAIPGVTVPATGCTPVTTITETAQYTGTVTWDSADNPFLGEQGYTATITLTPKAGFTFTGVAENYFTVAGATATNAAGSGTVTAVFPATLAAVVNITAIPGVTVPATGCTPVTTITETAQYTGTVTWDPADNSFLGEQVYTATITLTPKAGFTFTGVAENYFTVAGATATNAAGSGTVTAVFLLELAQVEKPNWDGQIYWNSVECASGYSVRVYQNGSLAAQHPNVAETAYDIETDISSFGAGIYTVTVQAQGDGITYADGPESEPSYPQTVTTGVELEPTQPTQMGGDGYQEVGTTTVIAGATYAGTLMVHVADGTLNRTIAVNVATGDDTADVAGKIRAALATDTGAGGVACTDPGGYTVTGSGAEIILTQNAATPGSDVDLQITLNETKIKEKDSHPVEVHFNYNCEGEIDDICVDNGTEVNTVIASIESADGSIQTYKVIDESGIKAGTDSICNCDQLIVTAEDGITSAIYFVNIME